MPCRINIKIRLAKDCNDRKKHLDVSKDNHREVLLADNEQKNRVRSVSSSCKMATVECSPGMILHSLHGRKLEG